MKYFFNFTVFIISTIFLMSGAASATPMLSISDGSTTILVEDNQPGDWAPDAGIITIVDNTLNNVTWSLTTGITKPTYGTATNPVMHLDSVNVTSTGAVKLELAFTETGFSTWDDVIGFTTGIGGSTDGLVTFDAYLDFGNSPFAQTTHIGSLGNFSNGAFSDTEFWTMSNAILGDDFSLTLIASIDHSGSSMGQVTSFNADVAPVPEPATLLLLGVGFFGVAGAGRRKTRKGKDSRTDI